MRYEMRQKLWKAFLIFAIVSLLVFCGGIWMLLDAAMNPKP